MENLFWKGFRSGLSAGVVVSVICAGILARFPYDESMISYLGAGQKIASENEFSPNRRIARWYIPFAFWFRNDGFRDGSISRIDITPLDLTPQPIIEDVHIIRGLIRAREDNEIVVSIIGGLANIKRLRRDNANKRILLLSDSYRPDDFAPIIISENDDFQVDGKVVDVIKGINNEN